MLASAIPAKYPVPWGNSAGASYINSIPTLSQIGVTAGRASLTDGFPPLNFVPVGAGGTPPFGGDFNGIFQRETAWSQWFQAGGPIAYDASFQSSIGGYPNGATVQSLTTPGLLWQSIVDNNGTNPDLAGAGWVRYARSVLQANASYFVNQGTGSDTTGNGSSGSPWATLQFAWNYIQNGVDLGGFALTVFCTGAFTHGIVANGAVVGGSGPASLIFSFTSGATVSCTSSGSPLGCFFAGTGAAYRVTTQSGTLMKITTSGGNIGGFTTYAGGVISIGSVNFGACSGIHIFCNGGGIFINSNYTISGGAQQHLTVNIGQGSLEYGVDPAGGGFTATTVTLTGTPAFSSAFVAALSGEIFAQSVTYSGSATGQRYAVQANGVIQTNGGGSGYFPGSSSGVANTGGQYI